jgi:hypothetical protein
VLHAGVAAAGADVVVQVGDRLPDAGMVGGQDGPADLRVAQAVEDRHALGGAQDHVEPGHRALAVRSAEELARVGVAALEHPPEPATDASPCSPRAVAPWHRGRTSGLGTPVAGQVLLVVGGEFAGVVLLSAHRELGHVRDHPAAASSPPLAPANAPLVHCCPRKNGCG